MSLLDLWNEEVEVFPEVVVKDKDGNTKTQASKESFTAKAMVHPVGQSGTSARRAEQDNEGFESEKLLRLRFVGEHRFLVLGAQSQIKIGDQLWSVFGDAVQYYSTKRTKHYHYNLRRS